MGPDRLNFATIARGGEYLRVADPEWANPLDPSHAKALGGRWNPPGSFPVLYLNADLATARANVDRKFAGLPYGPMDLLPARRPLLVGVMVPDGRHVDAATDAGCRRAGLPASYPRYSNGREVPRAACQRIGAEAARQRLPGIACRSAARPAGKELAWFTRRAGRPTRRQVFDDWYWNR